MADVEMAPKEEETVEQQTLSAGPKQLWDRFKTVIEEYGGAQQYLLQKYPDEEGKKRFADALQDGFPRREEVDYYLYKMCPPNDQPVIVHISDLGFGAEATTKPPPYKTVCLLVGEDIIKNTFQTEGAVRTRRPGAGSVAASVAGVTNYCGRLRG